MCCTRKLADKQRWNGPVPTGHHVHDKLVFFEAKSSLLCGQLLSSFARTPNAFDDTSDLLDQRLNQLHCKSLNDNSKHSDLQSVAHSELQSVDEATNCGPLLGLVLLHRGDVIGAVVSRSRDDFIKNAILVKDIDVKLT